MSSSSLPDIITSNKKKIGLGILIYTVFCVALGRYTNSEKIKIQKTDTQTSTNTENKNDKTTIDTHRDDHLKTVITEHDNKDGSKDKVTTITNDDESTISKNQDDTSSTKDSETDTSKDSEKISRGSDQVTISVLSAVKVTDLTGGLVYGVSITRPILGPLTVGAFGFTNSTVGLSIGLTF
jgi:hypothetical protein